MENISYISTILISTFILGVDDEYKEAVRTSKRCFQINVCLFS